MFRKTRREEDAEMRGKLTPSITSSKIFFVSIQRGRSVCYNKTEKKCQKILEFSKNRTVDLREGGLVLSPSVLSGKLSHGKFLSICCRGSKETSNDCSFVHFYLKKKSV